MISRKKSQRPWFRIAIPGQTLEGQKTSSGDLLLVIKFEGVTTSITVPRKSVLEMTDWLRKVYPTGVTNNVISISRPTPALPLSDSSGDPETSPPDSAG